MGKSVWSETKQHWNMVREDTNHGEVMKLNKKGRQLPPLDIF
jgi:hypothetical protein